MTAFRKKRFAAALLCLLLVGGILAPLSPAWAAESGGPPVTEVKAVSGGILVAWESLEGAAKYALYRRVDEEEWVKYTVVSGNSYTDRNVVFGSSYAYAVRPLDAQGGYIGPLGQVMSLTYGDAPKLGSVTSLSGGLRVVWDPVEGAGGYAVYRKAPGGGWRKYAVASGTAFTDRNVLPGVDYIYSVRAADQNGQYLSSYDKEGIGGMFFAPPKLLSAVNDSDGITVSWAPSEGADRYAVYRKTEGGSWGRYTITDDTRYSDRNVIEGQRYAYTILALNDKGTALGGYDPVGLSVTRFSDPEATVAQRLLARQNMDGYKEGSPWDGGVTRRNALPRNGCATGAVCGCGDYAFAMDMQEYAAEADARVRHVEARYDALPEIRVGDVLILESGARSVLVIDVAEDGHTVTVCEGNFGGAVHWGRVIDLADPDSGLIGVESFY